MNVTPKAIREERGRTAAGDPGEVPVAGTVEGAAPGEPGVWEREKWPQVGADSAFFLKGTEDG